VDEAFLEQFSRQLAGTYRGRDPTDPATHDSLDATLVRVREVIDRLSTAPDPGPEFPPWPNHEFSADDAARVKAAVLGRLP
jgi:hypothetical protein